MARLWNKGGTSLLTFDLWPECHCHKH